MTRLLMSGRLSQPGSLGEGGKVGTGSMSTPMERPSSLRAARATARVRLWLIEPVTPSGNSGAPRRSVRMGPVSRPRSRKASCRAMRPASQVGLRAGESDSR